MVKWNDLLLAEIHKTNVLWIFAFSNVLLYSAMNTGEMALWQKFY